MKFDTSGLTPEAIGTIVWMKKIGVSDQHIRHRIEELRNEKRESKEEKTQK